MELNIAKNFEEWKKDNPQAFDPSNDKSNKNNHKIKSMETIQGNLDGTQVQQPEVFPIDATKCKSLEEMGILLNALGLAMTKEYAAANKLEHLLIEE